MLDDSPNRLTVAFQWNYEINSDITFIDTTLDTSMNRTILFIQGRILAKDTRYSPIYRL